MNTLQTLTEKIQKHCPELLRPVTSPFYSKKDGNWYYDFVDSNGINQRSIPFGMKESAEKNAMLKGHFEVSPITLEHVLKAISISDDESTSYALTVLPDGNLLNRAGEGVAKWKLTKPLSDQSPETIEWLNSVIE